MLSARNAIRISALAAGLLASGIALADAQLDPKLVAKMAAAAPADNLQVVITYKQSVPVSSAQIGALKALGIDKGVTMRTLPIAGALATPAEIRALAQRSDVASIWFNAPLRYMNKEAREISGAARTVDNPGNFNRAIPFSGAGVTTNGLFTPSEVPLGTNTITVVATSPDGCSATNSLSVVVIPCLAPLEYSVAIEGETNKILTLTWVGMYELESTAILPVTGLPSWTSVTNGAAGTNVWIQPVSRVANEFFRLVQRP